MEIGNNILITGGLGFIGSYFAEKLSADRKVTILDNFAAHSKDAFQLLKNKKNVQIIKEDILNCDYSKHLPTIDTVFHFAANSDISSGVENPEIDFQITTCGTYRLLKSMADYEVKNIIYPSGSGVYGDAKETVLAEDFSPLEPVSFYGASKLSAESFTSAFCHMKGLSARVFRFANVVGYRQTHGVAFDLIKKLRNDDNKLNVLGDGRQSKSYIHVEDIYSGIMTSINEPSDISYDVFNLATQDYITVKEIVSEILNALDLKQKTKIEFGSRPTGWQGDVPIVRFNTDKIRSLGWTNKYNSRQAIQSAIQYLIKYDFN